MIVFSDLDGTLLDHDTYESVKSANAFDCEAFFELGVAGIVRETGLSKQQALRANDRIASEPILWRDLISGVRIAEGQTVLELRPYQTVWLSNA